MAQRQQAADVHQDDLCLIAKKADEMILQDMIQVSLAEHKSREEQEARENVALVYEHLAAEEIKKLVEDPENVDDSSPPRHDEPIYPAPRQQIDQLADIFKNVMMETLPLLVKEKLTKQVRRKFLRQICDQHSNLDALQDEFRRLSAKRQKTSEYEAYVSRESSSGQVNVEEPGPSTSGDEHQYHIDQMKNFLQSDIVWESRKEILVSSHPRKITPLVQSCQRDPEAPALSLINQAFVHEKKEIQVPEKIILFIRSSVIWERVHDFQLGIESYQQKINLTAPTITFPGIEECDVFSIVYEPYMELFTLIARNRKGENENIRDTYVK
ncbi:hypothetical protein Tco_0722817 [Tanacetum coccineum]